MLRQQEIIAVKEVGESIGYGNMMDIASALWSMKLSGKGTQRIAHVPTVESCMRKEEWKRTKEEVSCRIDEIKGYWIKV